MIFGIDCPSGMINNIWHDIDFVTFEDYNFQIPSFIEHTSILNGDKHFKRRGEYAEFTVLSHIQKNVNPAFTFTELYNTFNGKLLQEFKPHKDGDSTKDVNGIPIEFYCALVKPIYLDDLTTYDAIRLVFKALKYVDLVQSLP